MVFSCTYRIVGQFFFVSWCTGVSMFFYLKMLSKQKSKMWLSNSNTINKTVVMHKKSFMFFTCDYKLFICVGTIIIYWLLTTVSRFHVIQIFYNLKLSKIQDSLDAVCSTTNGTNSPCGKIIQLLCHTFLQILIPYIRHSTFKWK